MRKRTVAFLMSDFKHIGNDIELETMLKRVGRRHDMVALHLDDPLNHELPSLGWMRVQDPETSVTRWRNTSSRRVKRDWAQQSLAHRDTLTQLMARSGMDFTSISTQGSLVKPLLRIFNARG